MDDDDDERTPWWMWAIALAVGAGAVALAVALPGNFAYWLAPLLLLVPLWMLTGEFLDPWPRVPARRRAGAWLGGAGLALTGAGLVVAVPEPQTYLFGVLLLMPLVAVMIARQGDDEDRRDRGPDAPGSSTDGGLDVF